MSDQNVDVKKATDDLDLALQEVPTVGFFKRNGELFGVFALAAIGMIGYSKTIETLDLLTGVRATPGLTNRPKDYMAVLEDENKYLLSALISTRLALKKAAEEL